MVYLTVYTDTFLVLLYHNYARFSIRGPYCLLKRLQVENIICFAQMQSSSRNFRHGIAVTEYILGEFSSLSGNLTTEFFGICFEIEVTDFLFLCCFLQVCNLGGEYFLATCQSRHILLQVMKPFGCLHIVKFGEVLNMKHQVLITLVILQLKKNV